MSESPTDSAPPPSGFDQLGLSSKALAAIRQARYHEPTSVQAGMIPHALAGQDVMAQAQTGTGKTAAYALPILERSDQLGKQGDKPHTIVLVPTRELAVQVRDEFEELAQGRRIVCVALYGGKPIRKQVDRLRRGADVVVGTPGRVLDHLGRRSLDLSELQVLVLDEADRMLDIGFRPDIERILRKCPSQRQTLLLSATVPAPVERLARRYMQDPLVLNFSAEVASDTIDQYYFTVDQEKKFELLLRLLEREKPAQAIVFCRTRRGTDRVFRKLSKRIEHADCIHGDMQQGARDRVMRGFRAGEVKILIATDVVGRGIDVTGISHIINYDIPESCDDYVHRVGRTGRMGREGVAYSFVTPEEGAELTRIEIRVNKLLKRREIPGFETFADPSAVQPSATPPSTQVQRFGFREQPASDAQVHRVVSKDATQAAKEAARKKHRRAL